MLKRSPIAWATSMPVRLEELAQPVLKSGYGQHLIDMLKHAV